MRAAIAGFIITLLMLGFAPKADAINDWHVWRARLIPLIDDAFTNALSGGTATTPSVSFTNNTLTIVFGKTSFESVIWDDADETWASTRSWNSFSHDYRYTWDGHYYDP